MATRIGDLSAASPGRAVAVSATRTARRVRADRWARRLVVAGGLLIIAAIVAILVVIVAEIVPLFRSPTAALVDTPTSPAPAVAGDSVGVDEYREVAYVIAGDGVRFVALGRAAPALPARTPDLGAARITAAARSARDRYVLGTSDGGVVPAEVGFDVTFPDGVRTVAPRVTFGERVLLDPGGHRPVRTLAAATPEGGPLVVAQVGPTDLVMETVVEKKALVGPGTREVSVVPVAVRAEGEITALRVDGRGEDLFVATSRGQLLRYDLRDGAGPTLAETVEATASGSPVTALGFLNGDRTLVVGDRDGGVSTWQVVPSPAGGSARLARIHDFEHLGGPVVAVSPSPRDKGFVVASAGGEVRVDYGTSGRTLIRNLRTPGPDLRAIVFAPRADGVVAATASGRLAHWTVANPHPEVTLRTLFGPVWYEGYSQPEFVWQSTGGTDDFEVKLSLTPLIFGTLKGTFYALVFAVPLALLAALHVSEFMHPRLKGYLKPVVEIMAALPSVVLGFLAGLWLAPLVERVVPGMILLPAVLPACILAATLLWLRLPLPVRSRFRPGSEVFLLVPVVLGGLWLSFTLGRLAEAHLLGGDYRTWFQSVLGLTYDQRNSMVVGVAMGFAVVPIIFTIAEDSLASVPQHLRAGSLALGATRWQTALRVVLPTASPGIFSAIMIGFGRAVGETMIVLMATGNTPVMDWSALSGFRALSANIAVELPEAPEGGTLFRVLFVAAFLLFCLTFAVNTVAEVVRLRLRRRYRYL